MLDLDTLQYLIDKALPALKPMVHMNEDDDKYCVAVMVDGLPGPVACCFSSLKLAEAAQHGTNLNAEVARIFIGVLRVHHHTILCSKMAPFSPN